MALSLARAKLGQSVFTLGYPVPDQLGRSLKMTAGEISALAGDEVASRRRDDIRRWRGRMEDVRLLQISVPTEPGNRGGPVFDNTGRVVAIVVSGSDKNASINFALKIAYVRTLIDALPDLGGYAPPLPAASRAAAID